MLKRVQLISVRASADEDSTCTYLSYSTFNHSRVQKQVVRDQNRDICEIYEYPLKLEKALEGIASLRCNYKRRSEQILLWSCGLASVQPLAIGIGHGHQNP